ALFSFIVITAIVILCLVTFPLQIAMIVMGAKYKDDCPAENMIPIYLIVAGSAGLFSICCAGGVRCTSQEDDQQTVNPLSGLIQLFLFAWFIAGNVWIYSNYEPNYTDPSSPDFCNKTLYLFAFWVTNSYYILFGFVLGIMCLIGMGVACASQSEV
ncbi:unnamed protein product, partial [Porites evermanni]